jgi:hypothetical protein
MAILGKPQVCIARAQPSPPVGASSWQVGSPQQQSLAALLAPLRLKAPRSNPQPAPRGLKRPTSKGARGSAW